MEKYQKSIDYLKTVSFIAPNSIDVDKALENLQECVNELENYKIAYRIAINELTRDTMIVCGKKYDEVLEQARKEIKK